MKSTARAVGSVMIIMMFSRLLALVSNQVYITYYGINIEMDIYSYATQLPNIVFNSFGTALATVVIPIFAGYLGTGEKDRAFKFIDNIIGLSAVFTISLSILAILAAPGIVQLTRFRDEGYDFAVYALRIMFPVMIFYAGNYILQGVLQSFGKYNMPAFVSVPGSLIIILYVFSLGNRYGVKGLLISTFIGLAMQALILIPPLFNTEYRYRPSLNLRDKDITSALRLIAPVLMGTSAYQLNMLFNATLSANFKDTVAIMVTVQNLVLYAILAFIYSITAVVFPRFTFLAARNDMQGFKESLLKVLKSVIYFMIPATAGFVAVRHQLLDLLYGWGRVTADNVSLASNIMAFYAMGITGIGLKEVVDRAFYSLKDTKKPAITGVAIMAINISLSIALIQFISVYAIPLAYSVSALAGAALLLHMIRKKVGPFGGKQLFAAALKDAGAAAIMLLLIIPINRALLNLSTGISLVDKGIKLIVPSVAGAAIYFGLTCLFRVDEAVSVLNKINMIRMKLIRTR